ncbi:MAG: M23 family metallopeptidase [Methylomonas sp.]|nr:M23 family metallopeptidase [Methylomonas sp.]
MLARWLVFVALLLAFDSGFAKKLYKFQDEKGLWHFSDRPPATEREVEVRQLKPAPQQRVKLERSGARSDPSFHAVNLYPGPVEIAVDWAQQDNVIVTPSLPRHFVVGPGKSATLFTVSGGPQANSWQISLQYQYVIGEPLPDYVNSSPYHPPIAPGSRFRITQAFDGEFSHQDEQNRYAVDIMMPVATPIHAARSGVVLEVQNDFFNSGPLQAYADQANSVRILHDDGSMAVYAHLELEKAQVSPGMRVQAGELIAYSGNTGYTTGPHLHFAIQVNQGMQLKSVPFLFALSDGKSVEPKAGMWLEGFTP